MKIKATYTGIEVPWGDDQSVEDCLYLAHQVGDGVLLLLARRQVSVTFDESLVEGFLYGGRY